MRSAELFDVESKQELLTLEGKGSQFTRMSLAPDGNILGAVNARGKLHLWRPPTLEEIEAAETAQAAVSARTP